MPMTDEEWKRERAKLEDEIWSRYQRVFPKHPVPLLYWNGPGEKLDALMERAMTAGRPLTPDDLCRARSSNAG
jgi:hypothetical protein